MKNSPKMSPKAAKSGLSPKQQIAIQSLLDGRTKSQAAEAAGVAPRSLRRWFADPTFQAALTTATDAAISDAARRLAGTLDEAVTVLAEVMANKEEKAPDRLRAAGLIIGRGLDLIHQKEILDRIAALESQLLPSSLDY